MSQCFPRFSLEIMLKRKFSSIFESLSNFTVYYESSLVLFLILNDL